MLHDSTEWVLINCRRTGLPASALALLLLIINITRELINTRIGAIIKEITITVLQWISAGYYITFEGHMYIHVHT
jgi:hypothetical protein